MFIFSPFLLGLIVGSFLNVVIYRYGTGQTVGGRSQCLSCGRALGWHELVPVISFALQLGKCRHCGSRLSWQYPAVELATGVLFALVMWKFGITVGGVLALAAMSLLVVLVAYDIRHKIIPEGAVWAFALVSLLNALWRAATWQPFSLSWPLLWPALATAAGLALFFVLLWYGSGGRWMGLGDAKLAVGVGLLLGWPGGLSAIILAFWIGAVVGLALIAATRLLGASRSFTIKSEVPFAPFIVLGLLLVLFCNLDVFSFFL